MTGRIVFSLWVLPTSHLCFHARMKRNTKKVMRNKMKDVVLAVCCSNPELTPIILHPHTSSDLP